MKNLIKILKMFFYKNTNFISSKNSSGITLIALVITIIVLLILAGVSIATLTGDNGILTKATDAKNKTEKSNAREQVEIALMGSVDTNGNLNNAELKDNLNKIEGIEKVEEIKDGDYPITVKIDGESYLINQDGTIEEVIEREGIQIGDYVDYSYDTVEKGYSLLQVESGYTSDQTIEQTSGLKWRILAIHENGTVDLISETPTSQIVYFRGALGYNNGVLLINDICKELYSNSSLGIEARNINLKDIEEQMNEAGIKARDEYINSSSGTQYGDTKTYGSGYNQYPILYAKENGSGINTETVKSNGIDVNVNGYIKPTTETSDIANEGLTVKQTYYTLNMQSSYFNNTEVYNMIFGTDFNYWIASRYVYCFPNYADFGLRRVNNSTINGDYMFYSNGDVGILNSNLFPIISLSGDIKITSCLGENNSTNMHQISKY